MVIDCNFNVKQDFNILVIVFIVCNENSFFIENVNKLK